MMDRFRANALLDLYESMLTKRQQEICSLYYREDYSLSEIAENLHVSKAAVSDSIKKSTEAMNQLEDRLFLLKKEQQLKAFLSRHPEYESELSALISGKEEE